MASGVRLSSIRSWSDLLSVIWSGELSFLGRTSAVEEEYARFRQSLQQEWVNVEEFIAWKVFGEEIQVREVEPGVFKKGIQKCGGRWRHSNRIRTRIVQNDFPYALESGISHYLLWSLTCFSSEEIERLLEAEFDREIYEWIYFENPPVLKTIPEIYHVHVFTRKNPSKTSSFDVSRDLEK